MDSVVPYKEPTYEEIGKLALICFYTDAQGRQKANLPLYDLFRAFEIISNPPPDGKLDWLVQRVMGSRNGSLKSIQDMLEYFHVQQDKDELPHLLEATKGATSFLEIGSRFGGTLYSVAQTMAPKSLIVSVDAAMGDKDPCPHEPKMTLEYNARRIRDMGHECILIDADSQLEETVRRVRTFGQFDFGFIDADHSYEGVRKDWENYGPLCKTVGFHDIAGEDAGCVRLWNEIKKDYKHAEYVNPDAVCPLSGRPRQLGIGILHRCQ